MNKPFYVANDGQTLVDTNYWESEFNTMGAFYLTVNAGAARLLMPTSQVATLADMQTGQQAIITYGQWDGKEGVEVLFDDDSDTPFFMILSLAQCDRRITATAEAFPLIVYSARVEVWRCTAHVRVRPNLPCLEPWTAE
jgi:hypothetical protein